MEMLSGQKVSVWIDMYKVELAIMQAKGGVLTNQEGLNAFIVSVPPFQLPNCQCMIELPAFHTNQLAILNQVAESLRMT